MPKDSLKLKINGTVGVEDFRTAVAAWCDLVTAIAIEVGAADHVDWIISELNSGSAIMATRGDTDQAESAKAVETAVDRYDEIGKAAAEGILNKYPPTIRLAMEELTGVISGRIPSISLITDAGEQVVARNYLSRDVGALEDERPVTLRTTTRTALKGRVCTLNDQKGVYFTLEEAYTRRLIRCYPGADYKERLGEYWSHDTWVIVEGAFSRFSDRPTLIHITDIVPLEDVEPESWRRAVGAAPRPRDGSDMSSAEAVRKVRDGEE